MISLTSPVRTRAHSWPAGPKLGALAVAGIALFVFDTLPAQLGAFVSMLGLYALPGRLFLRTGIERLWVLWPFVAIIGLFHLVTQTWFEGLLILLRLVTAVGLANLVTMTTPLDDMIAVIRWLATPLRRFGLNTRALELSIALVIRILPTLIDNGQRLTQSWRARSRRRPGWQIVMPFTLLALDDAEHMADALRARGGLVDKKGDFDGT